MRSTLNAVKARLTNVPAHVLTAPANSSPAYYVLEPVPAGDLDIDRRLAAADPSVTFEMRVKSVAATGDGALLLAAAAKAELSPDGAPTPVVLAGRHVEISWVRFEAAYVDRDITITTGHPALAVETYLVSSQPA